MNNTKIKTDYKSVLYMGQIQRLAIQTVLGIGLLAGGIALLALRVAGWSIIFGLPMVVISSVFIIYTYDDVLSKNLKIQDDINAGRETSTDNATSDKIEGKTLPNKLI